MKIDSYKRSSTYAIFTVKAQSLQWGNTTLLGSKHHFIELQYPPITHSSKVFLKFWHFNTSQVNTLLTLRGSCDNKLVSFLFLYLSFLSRAERKVWSMAMNTANSILTKLAYIDISWAEMVNWYFMDNSQFPHHIISLWHRQSERTIHFLPSFTPIHKMYCTRM